MNLKKLQRKSTRLKPSVPAQILSAFAFAALLALAFASSEHGDQEVSTSSHLITKRSISTDLFDAAEQFGIGGSYVKKFRRLIDGTPPTVKDAFLEGDFSNVTESDIRGMNVSVLEFVPPNLLSKMASVKLPLIMPIIEKFLDYNRPNALGRLMGAVGDRLDTQTLLKEVKQRGGVEASPGGEPEKNEAAGVLLYSALNKLGDKGEITLQNVRSLATDHLLKMVPEEQLMKVKDVGAAKFLLSEYNKASGDELNDVDDKALIYQLAKTAYGPTQDWTDRTINNIAQHQQKILSLLPAAALQSLKPEVVKEAISTFRNTKLESPLQGKAVADAYLSATGMKTDEDDEIATLPSNLAESLQALGPLAAFVNPKLTNSSSQLKQILSACDNINFPPPFKAVTRYISAQTGGKSLKQLLPSDIRGIDISALKNGPPELIGTAMANNDLSATDLGNIGNVRSDMGGIGNSFLKGLIAQVAQYAIKQFTSGGRIDFSSLPGAFLGALGIKGMDKLDNTGDLDAALKKLKSNPDSLDDAQKALLLKRLKDAGRLNNLPPELKALLTRKSFDGLPDGILDGLPSDSELRLAHGAGKTLTAKDLARDPLLIGTLTPQQAKDFDLSEIPAVLAAVRKSKDGPPQQTLRVLATRFKEYVQDKSQEFDTQDRKLLKYVSAAEISKIPASVLAYFIDSKQTRKLPTDVRKEIMIAMGELSTKDHANIPAKTREEIILQGLEALEAQFAKEDKPHKKELGVPELAAIGSGVVDLPPERISALSTVATEQALDIITGMSDEDDDKLKQRACLSPEQKKAWGRKLQEVYGDVDSWDPAKVSSLCCSLALLDDEDLVLIRKDAIIPCRCPADEEPPSHLRELRKSLNANCKHEKGIDVTEHKHTLERVKSEDLLEELESQIITGRRRKRRDTKPQVNCYMIRIIGGPHPFDKAALETLSTNDITNCLYELGKEPLDKEIAKILWAKLVQSRGSVDAVTSNDFYFSGHILSGISHEDIPKLDVSDADVLAAFGKPIGLDKNTLEKLAQAYEEKVRKPPSDLTSNDLIILRNMLCGFDPAKLKQLQSEHFLGALPILRDLQPSSCEHSKLEAFASILTRDTVYGNVKNWSSADVRGAGVLIAGLGDHVSSIPPESFLGMTSSVAASLPDSFLSQLTAEQAAYFPRFSAQSLSESQLSHLSSDAKSKIQDLGPLTTAAASTHLLQVPLASITLIISAISAHRLL